MTRNRTGLGPWKAGAAALLLAAAAAGCSLDLTNPNAPPEEEVITTVDGMITLAVGLQSQYAENVNIFLRAPSLVTDEWGTRPIALPADVSLVTGSPDPSFGVVSDPFAAGYRIARTANILIDNAPQVELGTGLRAGITSLSRLMKAMALGNLYMQYEQLPANAGNAALPQPRAEVLDSVIALLEAARADVLNVPDADLAGFRTRVLGTGFDLRNTIDAMLARYYLLDGRYQPAIDAAGRVNLGVLSVLAYPNPGANPIYNYSAVSRYTGTRKVFFAQAEAGDQRPAYWALRTAGSTGTPDSVFDFRKYGARNDAYPLYLPDEMRLIQAEAYTRLGNFAAARTRINEVRTQAVGGGLDEPRAALPALDVAALDTEAELLTQILYERRYELYAQGLRWEDLRRLSAYTSIHPSMPFLPYPQSECDRNPADPC
ncbi:MAG TPA: RagB/SusD family nutrient uptake outer membrane protein [Longimicrobium sp.]|nr:RagB/SusD family nutrient uptake outer membrane protein [Longimicrobium sp.]